MLRTSLLAAAALGAMACSTLAASADDFRAQQYDQYNRNDNFGGYSGSGTNPPYCGPGLIPHVFPGGSGYRCQTLDGSLGRSTPY